jgi:hypothetical protein
LAQPAVRLIRRGTRPGPAAGTSSSEAHATLADVADSRIEKWRRWCDGQIKSEVLTLHLHRYAFREVRAIVEANKSLPESYFFEYLEDTYATTQAVAVRRQAEARSRVVTLGQLVTEIRDDAKRLTRKFWVGLWDNSDAKRFGVPDAAFTKQFAPDRGDHLDAAIPDADVQRLTDAARSVTTYVDQHVAHSDARPQAGLPTFRELDETIDFIGHLFVKYANLLTASTWATLEPAIQHDWKAVFRQRWIK